MDQTAFILELEQILRNATPEQYEALVDEFAQKLPRDFILGGYHQVLVQKARSGVTVEAFKAFYELIHGNEIVRHNEKAVEKCFHAHDIGEIFLYLGSRGFRKTSTLDVTLGAFLIGHFPHLTGLVTGASDPNAQLIARLIASIIEFHPAWKEVFPYVVPKAKSWGAEGYWVIRTHRIVNNQLVEIPREEWEQQQAKVLDPTFIGGGYRSSSINGKHPSLFLIADDLHDIDSSGSKAEREYIKMVFLTQILPTVIRENGKLLTWIIMTGVPFAKDDTYHDLREGGGTVFVNIPCMKRAPEKAEGAVYIDGINHKNGAVYEDIVGWWFLTWPENFGVETVMFWRSKGKAMFWQMFMLDINTAKTAGLRYYLYPKDKIDTKWPTNGGADPTGFEDDGEVGGHTHSSFAHAWLSKLPVGGLVLVGGTLKKCTMEKSKEYILEAQTKFENWGTTGVEDVGVGRIYRRYLETDRRIRVIASNLKLGPEAKGGIRSKPDRILIELAPWLENMTIRISDEENDYNMAIRRGLDDFYDLSSKDEAWDALDGLYHATKLFPECLFIPAPDDISPFGMSSGGSLQSAWSRI